MASRLIANYRVLWFFEVLLVFLPNKLKVCGTSVKQVPKSICSLHVSVSYFGNSHNISDILMIIIFVMIICDQ